MARIIECVPNCSEGRNKEIIEYIADAVRSVPGVALMDYSSTKTTTAASLPSSATPTRWARRPSALPKPALKRST